MLELQNFQAWLTATDVFVASHHGREAGYCAEVFEYCQPKIVIVSDGPGCETSAVNKYCGHSQGWYVRSSATGLSEKRLVVTTRSDGSIVVEAYRQGTQNYLAVSKE